MSYGHYIKELGRGAEGSRDLTLEDARQLYAAMLDGGVPDLELGAILIALRVKGEATEEMLGFMQAIDAHLHRFDNPQGRARPVILPTYNGARKEANLTPLLALLLKRFGVPVLIHGLIEGYGRVTTAQIFRELGILPAISPTQAQQQLREQGLSFVPLSAIAPGLHQLLSLRARMGVRNSAHSLVKMINPFAGEAVLLAPATHPDFIALMRELLMARDSRALLLRGTEGEPFANPKRRPRLEYIHDGQSDVLFEGEHESLRALPALPDGLDAAATAAWTRKVLEHQMPLPKPLADQVACCLVASGYATDLTQAKALVAVELCGGYGGGN